MEHEIVAELGLGEEQPMPTAGLIAFDGGEEWRKAGKPLLAATDEIARGQFVGELLQAPRFGATYEGVGALPKVDALLAHPVGPPMMLVEADPRRERQVGAYADEHAVPASVVDIEVELNDAALGELQMPAVGGPVANGGHDAGGLPRLQNDDDRVGLGAFEIGLDGLVATPFRGIQNRNVLLRRHYLSLRIATLGARSRRRFLRCYAWGYECRNRKDIHGQPRLKQQGIRGPERSTASRHWDRGTRKFGRVSVANDRL